MMNFGLIGKSLSHSFSKSYFEEKFKTESLSNFNYSNFDIDNLDNLIDLIIENHLSGVNITKPYKELVIPFLNEINPIAKQIEAVNCIKIKWNNTTPYLTGYNTDYYGFSQSIKPFLEPIHQKALILGTGGASKAIAYVLQNIGIDVFYVTSSVKKAENYFLYSEINEYVLNAFKLIVNCTPVGIFPNINECPNIPYNFLSNNHLLYDLTYNPSESLFLQKGKAQGAVVINGLNMLKLQADKSLEIWTSN